MGLQLKVGGKFHLKLNIGGRPIEHKYREGKMNKNFEKRVKEYLKLLKGKRRKLVFNLITIPTPSSGMGTVVRWMSSLTRIWRNDLLGGSLLGCLTSLFYP